MIHDVGATLRLGAPVTAGFTHPVSSDDRSIIADTVSDGSPSTRSGRRRMLLTLDRKYSLRNFTARAAGMYVLLEIPRKPVLARSQASVFVKMRQVGLIVIG